MGAVAPPPKTINQEMHINKIFYLILFTDMFPSLPDNHQGVVREYKQRNNDYNNLYKSGDVFPEVVGVPTNKPFAFWRDINFKQRIQILSLTNTLTQTQRSLRTLSVPPQPPGPTNRELHSSRPDCYTNINDQSAFCCN